MQIKWPWVIGGVAVVGVGWYLYSQSNGSSTDTTAGGLTTSGTVASPGLLGSVPLDYGMPQYQMTDTNPTTTQAATTGGTAASTTDTNNALAATLAALNTQTAAQTTQLGMALENSRYSTDAYVKIAGQSIGSANLGTVLATYGKHNVTSAIDPSTGAVTVGDISTPNVLQVADPSVAQARIAQNRADITIAQESGKAGYDVQQAALQSIYAKPLAAGPAPARGVASHKPATTHAARQAPKPKPAPTPAPAPKPKPAPKPAKRHR